jgi:hypothetical protein
VPKAYVYIVRIRGHQKPIKICCASNLKQHFASIQSNAGKILEFVTAFGCADIAQARVIKQLTHDAFAEYRVRTEYRHREWFMIESREAIQSIIATARAQNMMILPNIHITHGRLHPFLLQQNQIDIK